MAEFDQKQFMDLIGGDLELFRELVTLFTTDWPNLCEELARATAAEDRARIQHVAHRLKGNARNFFAAEAAGIADEIERNAMSAPASEIAAVITRLKTAFSRLDTELRASLDSALKK